MEEEVMQSNNITTPGVQSEPLAVSQPITQTPGIPKQKPWLILALVILTLFLLGIIGFFAYRNYQLKKNQQVIQLEPSPIGTKAVPTPEKSLQEIKIIDGNVCQLTATNEVKILVNKDDFQSENISGFDQVVTSPDETKMCFLGYSSAPVWDFYSANIDGSNVVKVGFGKNCVWSHDSQKIAFNNHTTDVSSVDIYVYDTLSEKTDNITESLQAKSETDAIRFYKIPIWSEDDSKISGEFVSVDLSGQGWKEKNGISIINIITGEIEDTIEPN